MWCHDSADEETFPLDFCKKFFWLNCSNICSNEIQVLQLQKNKTVCFLCWECQFVSLHKLIDSQFQLFEVSLTTKFQKLRKPIEEQDDKRLDQTVLKSSLSKEISLSKLSNADKRYADIVTNKRTEVIQVKDKKKQESNTTKKDLTEKSIQKEYEGR